MHKIMTFCAYMPHAWILNIASSEFSENISFSICLILNIFSLEIPRSRSEWTATEKYLSCKGYPHLFSVEGRGKNLYSIFNNNSKFDLHLVLK